MGRNESLEGGEDGMCLSEELLTQAAPLRQAADPLLKRFPSGALLVLPICTDITLGSSTNSFHNKRVSHYGCCLIKGEGLAVHEAGLGQHGYTGASVSSALPNLGLH